MDLGRLLPGYIDSWGDMEHPTESYENYFGMYARLAFRNEWTAAGEQVIEGVLWMRMVEELGYLTLFEQTGPLHLALLPTRTLFRIRSPLDGAQRVWRRRWG